MLTRRNILKTLLAAPAVIRSGVLMPVVPLVAAVPAGVHHYGKALFVGGCGHADSGDIGNMILFDRELTDREVVALLESDSTLRRVDPDGPWGSSLIAAWTGGV